MAYSIPFGAATSVYGSNNSSDDPYADASPYPSGSEDYPSTPSKMPMGRSFSMTAAGSARSEEEKESRRSPERPQQPMGRQTSMERLNNLGFEPFTCPDAGAGFQLALLRIQGAIAELTEEHLKELRGKVEARQDLSSRGSTLGGRRGPAGVSIVAKDGNNDLGGPQRLPSFLGRQSKASVFQPQETPPSGIARQTSPKPYRASSAQVICGIAQESTILGSSDSAGIPREAPKAGVKNLSVGVSPLTFSPMPRPSPVEKFNGHFVGVSDADWQEAMDTRPKASPPKKTIRKSVSISDQEPQYKSEDTPADNSDIDESDEGRQKVLGKKFYASKDRPSVVSGEPGEAGDFSLEDSWDLRGSDLTGRSHFQDHPGPRASRVSRTSRTSIRTSRRSLHSMFDGDGAAPIAPQDVSDREGHRNSDMLYSQSMKEIIPQWYGQSKVGLEQGVVAEEESGNVATTPSPSAGKIAALVNRQEKSKQDHCVISPLATHRIFWDFAAMMLLLYDMWSMPVSFVVVSAEGIPSFMKVMDWVVVVFFSVDILLNFMTGYVQFDKLVLTRWKVARQYLRTWFLLDFMATMPWDLVLANLPMGDMVSAVRLAKVTKALKTLRFLKMIRAVRMVQQASMNEARAAVIHDVVKLIGFMATPVACLLALGVVAHINGCLWIWLQPDWEGTDNWNAGMLMYLRGMSWAWNVTTFFGLSSGETPPLWVLDMCVSTQRLFLGVYMVAWSLDHAAASISEQSHLRMLRRSTIAYLRRHKVSNETQVQVLYSIEETSRALSMQRHAEDLLGTRLHKELRRTICIELWGPRLMSLGLFSHVSQFNEELISEIAQRVHEEVFASKTILFTEGDPAFAAYYIIKGSFSICILEKPRASMQELSTSSPVATVGQVMAQSSIPDFIDGSWLGEKSLVNPTWRRAATARSNCLSCLMNVNGKDFHSVLKGLGVFELFHEFCQEQLWRGLCGRCGTLGQHFTHACPMASMTSEERRKEDTLPGSFPEWMGGTRSMKTKHPVKLSKKHSNHKCDTPVSNDLARFLETQGLVKIKDALLLLGVHDLAGLQALDQGEFVALIARNALNDEEVRHLSRDSIRSFISTAKEMTDGLLFDTADTGGHFVFLSHYKVEAGTEAALIRHELEAILNQDPGHPAHNFEVPIFLDAEDLTSLGFLQERVRKTHNLLLLLSKDVLKRPWVLVEIVTAFEAQVPVVPMLLCRGFNQFEFPTGEFLDGIMDGTTFGQSTMEFLWECGIDPKQLKEALQHVFKEIAVPYSPHRPCAIRNSELQAVLKHCRIKHNTFAPRVS